MLRKKGATCSTWGQYRSVEQAAEQLRSVAHLLDSEEEARLCRHCLSQAEAL